MTQLLVKKAAPVGDNEVEPITIVVEEEIEISNNNPFGEFRDQARKLESALIAHLPGGTYDQLLGLMLQRRASQLIVPLEDA